MVFPTLQEFKNKISQENSELKNYFDRYGGWDLTGGLLDQGTWEAVTGEDEYLDEKTEKEIWGDLLLSHERAILLVAAEKMSDELIEEYLPEEDKKDFNRVCLLKAEGEL